MGDKAAGELRKFELELTCARLRPIVVAALKRATAAQDVMGSERVRAAAFMALNRCVDRCPPAPEAGPPPEPVPEPVPPPKPEPVPAAGAEKRDAVDRIRAGEDLPGARIRAERVVWLGDRAALGAQ